MAEEKVKLRLQGHEKFALREGWLNKGLAILGETPDVFLRKDAPDIFGIGSNMVKSLRYWMRTLGLTNSNGSALTDLAKIILQYDPYFEKSFTWWILHSNIARNKEEATTWYLYFNYCDADDLDKDEICAILYRELSMPKVRNSRINHCTMTLMFCLTCMGELRTKQIQKIRVFLRLCSLDW